MTLVRSKTPKITLYTDKAKCMLMENGPSPDYEACFYDGKCVCMRVCVCICACVCTIQSEVIILYFLQEQRFTELVARSDVSNKVESTTL